jgi:glucoamylase
MVLRAARYLIQEGPATPQERWEEASGYSPSTLASNIAALTCVASFARERGDDATAQFIQDYADFLECRIEAWTVTTEGTLVPGINRHFIRINPVEIGNPQPDEDPNRGVLRIPNRPPFAQAEFHAKEVIDAGFLELVRYGIRKAGDPLIEDSLQVVDAILKVETPFAHAGVVTTMTAMARGKMVVPIRERASGARGRC